MSDKTSSTDSAESFDEVQMGGKRRKNGHKYSCKCPICINMKHAKRGGDNDELAEDLEEQQPNMGSQVAGRKKKGNGHKPTCGCPICKNMRKKGGKDDEFDDSELGSQIAGRKKKGNGHKPSCGCPICQNMRKKGGEEDKKDDKKEDDMQINETEALDEEYDNLDQDMSFISGGTRKRKSRKLRRSKKTRKNRKRSHKRRR
jgi:hypothetical protein